MMNLQLKNRILDLTRPQVMGILNITPDSFFDGNCYFGLDHALRRVQAMIAEGADLIDVGGESTRPGAIPIDSDMQLERILPVVEKVCAEFDVCVSVDTSQAGVIRAVDQAGAHLINDIRALRQDGALQAFAQTQMGVCLMHMQGTPQTMQAAPRYHQVTEDICTFLSSRLAACVKYGIPKTRIILDPGFGFGKTLRHNCQVLEQLDKVCALGQPVLVGLSRKSMIGLLLNQKIEERLQGSVAAALLAVMRGAHIIRTHDVAATKQALTFYNQWQEQCALVDE